MADRPVRSSNRRNTPQSPPKPTTSTNPQSRVLRSTTSQSHDVSDSETGRTATKGGPRGARQASSESVQSIGSHGSQAGKRTKRGPRARAANDLSVVPEDADVAYPELDEGDDGSENLDDDAAVQNQLRRETKSPGAVSAISGTTARTSHSAQELAYLDPEIMLDALPDLLGVANKILNLLAPQNALPAHIIGTARKLQDPASRASKNLQRLQDIFQLQKDLYGSEQYINITITLRALLKARHFHEVGSGPWRPDAVLQMANLTTLAMTIVPARRQDPPAQNALEKLGREFPKPFLFGFEAIQPGSVASMGNSSMSEGTFAMALEVRTQVFIMLVSRHMDQPNFDPDTVLHQVFFESENVVQGWDTPGLRSEELSKQQVEVIKQRVRKIRFTFPEDSQALRSGRFVDLERLSALFSWPAFITQIASWCRMRQDEIEVQMDYQGGFENIAQALGDEIMKRATLLTTDAQGEATDGEGRSPLVQIHFEPPSERSEATPDQLEPSHRVPLGAGKLKIPRSSFKSAAAIAHLKQRSESKAKPSLHQELPEVATGPQFASTQLPTPATRHTTSHFASTAPAKITNDMQARQQSNDPWREPDFDDGGTEPLLKEGPYAEQRRQMANRPHFDLDTNKENNETRPSATMPFNKKPSFIDRQPNAERVPFDESQQSRQQGLPNDLGRRRPRPLEDRGHIGEEAEDEGEISDISEDGGFEKDTRAHDTQWKRRAAPVGKRRAPAAAESPPAKRTQQTHAMNEDDDDEEEELRATAHQHNTANAPRPSHAQIYKRANDQAKLLSATQPKKVQRRNAWSEEETETLIQYIETIGTSWVQISKTDDSDGKVLQSRDQVALKDKARNMKMDFLKVGVDMPRHFDRIPLSNLQIEQLRGLGISYNERTGRRGYAVEDEDDSDDA